MSKILEQEIEYLKAEIRMLKQIGDMHKENKLKLQRYLLDSGMSFEELMSLVNPIKIRME